MGKIFYIMGKSSSGKDSIYRQLEKDQELGHALSGKNIQKKQPFIIRLLPRQNRSRSASLSATGIWLLRLESSAAFIPRS